MKKKDELKHYPRMLLYIGNMLQKHGYAPTSIETVGGWLAEEYPIKRVSSYKNQVVRFVDMMITLISYRRSCKLVLIDTYSGKAFWYALLVAWFADKLQISYVPILRGGELPRRFDKSKILSKRFISQAATIITPSYYLEHEIMSRGWGRPVCIPNAIELHGYTFKKRVHIRPYLLWVRSFHKIYNPLMALEVLKELISEKGYEDAKLCMIGQDKDGSMKIFHDKVLEYGLSERVEITGQLPKKQWIEKSEEFDIFLNTTNIDNTPVSVIEAMALGLPVISTKVGGIPFLINDGYDGLLVDKSDVNAMVKFVRSLVVDNYLTQELCGQARKKVENFSWDKIKPQWQRVMNDYYYV